MIINKISIVGMGSLGLLFGSFLADKLGNDHIEFIMDEERKRKYEGIEHQVNGRKYNFNKVCGSESDRTDASDLVIFAVKSTSLDEAIEVAKSKISDHTIILSLINGMTSEQILGKVFGMEKILYTIAEGMDPIKTENNLNYTNMGYLRLGTDTEKEGKAEKLNQVIELFDKIEFPYILEKDVMHRLWSKFMLNVGVNQVIMICEGTFGTIQRQGPERELVVSAMREVITLAEKECIKVTEEDLNFYISLVDTLNPEGMPSMRYDGLHKIKSEVELFSGMVLKLGRKHGIATPINQSIYNKVREMEKSYSL